MAHKRAAWPPDYRPIRSKAGSQQVGLHSQLDKMCRIARARIRCSPTQIDSLPSGHRIYQRRKDATTG